MKADPLINVSPLGELVDDWKAFLAMEPDTSFCKAIKQGERTGRPLGGGGFTEQIELLIGRSLARKKPGRKPKTN